MNYNKYNLIDSLMKRLNDIWIDKESSDSNKPLTYFFKDRLNECLNAEFDDFHEEDDRYKEILSFLKKIENGIYPD